MVPLLQWLLLLVLILILYKMVSVFGDPELMQAVQDWWAGDTESWWDRPPSTGPAVSLCSLCHREARQRCSMCQSAKYCSRQCQRDHWRRGHKSECAELAKARLAAEEPHALGIRPPLHSIFPYDAFLALLSDKSLSRRPPLGLANCGNSCYANAVLQCLLATPPLAAYLHLGRHKAGCIAPANSWCALCALQELAEQMFDPEQSVASAKGFMQHIKKLGKDFAIGRQEDSHEFLVQLLDAIETIMLRERGRWADLDAPSKETTLVHHIFGSYLRSECVCGVCGHASRSYECAITLEVQVPSEGHNLEAALERFSAEDVLEGDNMYNCERCARKVRAYRSTRIDVAPNVLQICLKRYRHMPGRFHFKNNAKVAYGEKLDLAPYMATVPLDSQPVRYTLYGVVVHLDHMNSTHFGHYVSFVRTGDDRWFDCDDMQVMQVTKNAVLERNAYMLFYLRDEPRRSLASLCDAYRGVHEAAASANMEAATSERSPTQSMEGDGMAPLTPPSMLHRIMTSPAALEHMVQDGTSSSFYQSAQYGSFLQLAPDSSEDPQAELASMLRRRHTSGSSATSSTAISSAPSSPMSGDAPSPDPGPAGPRDRAPGGEPAYDGAAGQPRSGSSDGGGGGCCAGVGPNLACAAGNGSGAGDARDGGGSASSTSGAIASFGKAYATAGCSSASGGAGSARSPESAKCVLPARVASGGPDAGGARDIAPSQAMTSRGVYGNGEVRGAPSGHGERWDGESGAAVTHAEIHQADNVARSKPPGPENPGTSVGEARRSTGEAMILQDMQGPMDPHVLTENRSTGEAMIPQDMQGPMDLHVPTENGHVDRLHSDVAMEEEDDATGPSLSVPACAPQAFVSAEADVDGSKAPATAPPATFEATLLMSSGAGLGEEAGSSGLGPRTCANGGGVGPPAGDAGGCSMVADPEYGASRGKAGGGAEAAEVPTPKGVGAGTKRERPPPQTPTGLQKGFLLQRRRKGQEAAPSEPEVPI